MKKKSQNRSSRTFIPSKVFIPGKEWLALKPYDQFTRYDEYYTRLAGEMVTEIRKLNSELADVLAKRNELNRLALVLTSYFEDIANETGIWKAFADTNFELYGMHIPMFEAEYDVSGYDPGELNISDLAYLTWHFLNRVLSTTYAPDFPTILDIAVAAYDMFDERIDEAPLTDYYETFLAHDPHIDFYELKDKLTWLALESYPLAFEFGVDHLKELSDAVLEFKDKEVDRSYIDGYMYSLKDKYIYGKPSSYSALSAPIWLSRIQGLKAEQKANLVGIKNPLSGIFTYEGKEKEGMAITFCPKGPRLVIPESSIGSGASDFTTGDLVMMSLVPFSGQWFMTGMLTIYPGKKLSDPDSPAHTQQVPFHHLPMEEQQEIRNLLSEMNQEFLDFFGAPLFTPENRAHFEEKFIAFLEFQHNNRQKELAKEKRTPFSLEIAHSIISQIPSQEQVTVAFTPGEGQHFFPTPNELIEVLKKQGPSSKEEKGILFSGLANYLAPEITRHLLTTYPLARLNFPNDPSKWDMLPFIEFWMRYNNPDDFKEKVPNLRLVGGE